MKVFLSASPRGSELFGKQYRYLYDYLKELEYQHLDDDLVKVNEKSFHEKMTKQGREAYVELYKRKTDAIHNADICIFEASLHSLGLGFLVQRALDLSKPSVILYYKDNTPFFFSGIDDEKLIVRGYDDKNYKEVITEIMDLARERRDKRFNFFLSPKLLDYLEDASNKQGVTKSKLIRDMIVEHMRENSVEPQE